jgi:2-polyprenyl-3-methyl-5-hydroxy-6-metoxy-1,4-benzoquinol methylase
VITVDFNRLGNLNGCRILDIGCGTGRHLSEVLQYENTKVFGADIHQGDLREAQKRIAYLKELGLCKGAYQLLSADIGNLPFEDNFFDLVICSEVLEHIPDHHKALAELVRVLKPGTTLVISVPRYVPEKICWFLSEEYHQAENGHIRIYKKNDLIRLSEKAGLNITTYHYAHSLHTPYWWLKCLLGVNREDSAPVRLYHRFLLWDMMKKPKLTRFSERLLNPLMGKSIVFYLTKFSGINAGVSQG